jgi:Cd2+/Zn2+-exporting ATPase
MSVQRIPGVLFADVNFASGLLLIEYDREADPRAAAVAAVVGAGHGIEAVDVEGGPRLPAVSWWVKNRTEVRVGVASLFLVLGWLLGGLPSDVPSIAAFALAIIVGGSLVWRRAVTSLMARTLDMNVLMTLAVSGAAALGEWGEGATVIVLFALGGMLESRSVERTRRSIGELMSLAPERARLRQGDTEIEVPPADVAVGSTIVVRPGERAPLDGIVAEGASAFDEAPITGESLPVDKDVGDTVYAGTLNTSGLVAVVTTAPAAETTIARIVHLVETAQASRAPVQRFVDRFSRVYTPIVMLAAAAVAIGGPILAELGVGVAGIEGWRGWVYRALTLLVISCPCALVVSTPVAVVSAIARATRDGVLVKGGAFLERAARIGVVAFDKTGTLTEGRPVVVETIALADEPVERVASLAAAVEAHSNHPLAAAVVAAAVPAEGAVSGVSEIPGQGVSGQVDGVRVAVGSVSYAEGQGVLTGDTAETARALEERGLTVLVVAVGEGASARAIGLLGVADAVRANAARAVADLRGAGVSHVAMLTGDNPAAAARVAEMVGISEYRAHLLPEGKTDAVGELREAYGPIAVVGDGINDAPALASADIGIAMGAAASQTALETADVALLGDDLSALPRFIGLGRRTMRIVRQNIALSLAVKAVFLVLAMTGHATLWMAVFADTGIALVVIANGLRLLGAWGARRSG